MNKLSGQDALFLHLDLPNASSHVSMVYIYDQSMLAQPLRFRQIVTHLEERLDVSPMFRSKIIQTPLGLAYPYWADDTQFDIDFHVRHLALPKPGDWRQFCIMVARIHARPIDLTRPPWEMHVIEGLDNTGWLPEGSFAVVMKIHHAAIDGTAASELTAALHDVAGAHHIAAAGRKNSHSRPQALPSLRDTIGRIVVDNVSAPFKLAGPLARTLPKLSLAAAKMISRKLLEPESGVPQTRFNQPVSGPRVFESVVFDFAAIKRIRGAVPGATVNDAALAIVGGAMRSYLTDKGELPKKSLAALAPVNTREDISERQTTGNAISFLTFTLASDIPDPIERLRKIQEATSQTKAKSSAIGGHDLTDISKFAPPATLAVAGRIATSLGLGGMGKVVLHNCMVTNVPGPKAELNMLGARLCYWSGAGPVTDGGGAIFVVSSLGDRMVISLTSCPDMVPDPAFFGDCIRASIAELDDAAAATAGIAAQAAPRSGAKARPVAKRAKAGGSPRRAAPK